MTKRYILTEANYQPSDAPLAIKIEISTKKGAAVGVTEFGDFSSQDIAAAVKALEVILAQLKSKEGKP